MQEDIRPMLCHLTDLAERSERQGCYTYSPFLSMGEQDGFLRETAAKLSAHWQFFGGVEAAERKLLRFGSPDELGYEEDIPILCLKICPVNARFAEDLTHRDFLGAALNLGIDRGVLGDIVVRPECAYLFCAAHMGDFLMENLTQVKHTRVRVSIAETMPEGELFRLEQETLPVSSLRLDGVLAHLYHLSRTEAASLFAAGYVFCNGRQCQRPDTQLKEGDIISLRHKGRFRVGAVAGVSRKGRLYLTVEKYV